MYILKNAYKSITRNKGRNILIGIIILVISISSTISLAILNSADTLIDSYKSANKIEATISFNRDNMMNDFRENKDKEQLEENFSNIESLTSEEIEEFGSSSYVSSYYYTTSISVNGIDLEKASSDMNFKMNRKEDNDKVEADFTLKGYSTYQAMSEFIDGNYKITEGEISSDFDGYNCIINEEIATLNDIEVGDTITLVDPNNEDNTYEFTVTGIYKEESDNEEMSLFSNSSNTIITNSNIVLEIAKNDEINYQINPTYILTSEDDIDSFVSDVESMGLDDNYQVTTNLEQIEENTSSISNVKTFATTFLIITFILGAIILFVINQINLRERRYEIGVLRVVGMKKIKVAMQFLSETLIVAFIFLIFGFLIGGSISTPVANKLLEQEIENSAKKENEVRENFGGFNDNIANKEENNRKDFGNNFNNLVSIDTFDSFDATISVKVLLELLGISIIIILLGTSSALIAINRFSPLTILKERS